MGAGSASFGSSTFWACGASTFYSSSFFSSFFFGAGIGLQPNLAAFCCFAKSGPLDGGSLIGLFIWMPPTLTSSVQPGVGLPSFIINGVFNTFPCSFYGSKNGEFGAITPSSFLFARTGVCITRALQALESSSYSSLTLNSPCLLMTFSSK